MSATTAKPLSTKAALLQFLQANAGRVVSTDEITSALREAGAYREKWSQRLSELRTDDGYDIYNHQDRDELGQGQYLMPVPYPTRPANPRKKVSASLRRQVVERDGCCQFEGCGLREGDTDPSTGAVVKLTADHILPHSQGGRTELENLQAMCVRHQLHKSNRYDGDGLNVPEALRVSDRQIKQACIEQLATWEGGSLLAAVGGLDANLRADAVGRLDGEDFHALAADMFAQQPENAARALIAAGEDARARFMDALLELDERAAVGQSRLADAASKRRRRA